MTEWYDKYPPAAAGSKRHVCTLEDAEEGDVDKVAEPLRLGRRGPLQHQRSGTTHNFLS